MKSKLIPPPPPPIPPNPGPSSPPLCGCGCGQPVRFNYRGQPRRFIKGHHWAAQRKVVLGETPPLCACGCGEPVKRENLAWHTYANGHQWRGRKRTEEDKQNKSRAIRAAWKGRRRRDWEEKPGKGVYSSWEFREAKAALMASNPACQKCGGRDRVQAHHEKPGDDSSLVPLCFRCHPEEHGAPGHAGKRVQGEAPLCACGCGLPTAWKRVRGWAKYRKGHWGAQKLPAGSCKAPALLCGCGCGEAVTFRFGKGWSKYKRGHGQRIEGPYNPRLRRVDSPA